MSLKKIEQVKNSKWFKWWDLIIYGSLIAVIVALILVFALSGKGGKLDGVIVSYKGEKIFSYSFSNDGYQILSAQNIEVEEDSAERLELTFYTDGRTGYNTIEINKSEKSVKITRSDCSWHKDCVYTAAINTNRSVPILCTPHALSVSPLKIYDDGTIKT